MKVKVKQKFKLIGKDIFLDSQNPSTCFRILRFSNKMGAYVESSGLGVLSNYEETLAGAIKFAKSLELVDKNNKES